VHGARTWASTAVMFAALLRHVEIALVDGGVGVVQAPGGKLARVLDLTIEDGRITRIDIVADPARLERIEVSAFAS